MLIANALTDAERAAVQATAAELPTERDALRHRGERCSPCADCGRVFTEAGLRLRCGEHPRMLCRSCLALAKKGAPRG